jgi:hypothetical protein
MRVSFLVACAACLGCSTTAASGVAIPAPIPHGPASWQGPAADRMNERASGPATPALRDLVGQVPLVYVARVPAAHDQPGWELAVFDDGTLIYEGHRCVETGGVLVTHLRADELGALRDAVETLCPEIEHPTTEDELCDTTTLRLVCASRIRLALASDHCRERYPALAHELDAIVDAVWEHSKLASWIGPPTRRLSCAPGSRDLSPHDLARTIRSDLAEAGALTSQNPSRN